MTPSQGRVGLPTAGLIAIIGAQLVWFAGFLAVPLPNTGAAQIRRLDLLLALDDHLGPALRNLSHVANLAERIPIVLASLFVAAASLAVGAAILRAVRIGPEISRGERVALGFGLGSAILGVATLLLGRWVGLSPLGVRVALGGLIVAGVGVEFWARGRLDRPEVLGLPRWSVGQILGFGALVGPFVLKMGLGALLPTIEFDALEYHLQGPKEYFLAGQIQFLPHNVYASMPSGVEMGTTLAMAVMSDWWLGRWPGKS